MGMFQRKQRREFLFQEKQHREKRLQDKVAMSGNSRQERGTSSHPIVLAFCKGSLAPNYAFFFARSSAKTFLAQSMASRTSGAPI